MKQFLPAGWKPWPKARRRSRWRFGDPSGKFMRADRDYASYLHPDGITFLHPHLRRKEHHDFFWEKVAHEALHAIRPKYTHRSIRRMERRVGQFLHDMSGCRKCDDSSRPKSGSRRS